MHTAYRPTIGLEIHAELATKTKLFCESANDPDEERPNSNICPICLAHPGTLPAINHEALWHVRRIGAALNGTLAEWSEFDRKNYFYPDIPKGYQISQYASPLVVGGELAGIAITRVHLEEDTARSVHTGGNSLIDFNRAGIPLMELVTEPAIPDAGTAGRFARELQLLLRTLRASDANLEKGEMRIEANVSVSKREGQFGTKVEIKNLNSFRSVERAIAFEIARQTTLLVKGERIVQETRGWNEAKQETFHQRYKEGSADYRYFPEPDLPAFRLSDMPELSAERVRASLPELPWERRNRYANTYQLKVADIAYLSASPERAEFFDAVATTLKTDNKLVTLAANYIVSDLAGLYARHGIETYATLDPISFAKLIQLIASRTLSSRGAKDVLPVLIERGGDPEALAKERNLLQIHDVSALDSLVETVLARETKAVSEYKSGKQAALQYLVGVAMRESKGAGNPIELQKIIAKRLA